MVGSNFCGLLYGAGIARQCLDGVYGSGGREKRRLRGNMLQNEFCLFLRERAPDTGIWC